MKHLFSVFLMCFFPLLMYAQSVTILNTLIANENSSADVQYNNEFGRFRNDEQDDPFPYFVIKMEFKFTTIFSSFIENTFVINSDNTFTTKFTCSFMF